jgi:isocitrate/isopropylmalate dehydrogenase
MAMILAGASLLAHIGGDARQAGRAITESVFEAVYDGVRTSDIGGHTTTSEFTDNVIERVKRKLEVWPSLGT